MEQALITHPLIEGLSLSGTVFETQLSRLWRIGERLENSSSSFFLTSKRTRSDELLLGLNEFCGPNATPHLCSHSPTEKESEVTIA